MLLKFILKLCLFVILFIMMPWHIFYICFKLGGSTKQEEYKRTHDDKQKHEKRKKRKHSKSSEHRKHEVRF